MRASPVACGSELRLVRLAKRAGGKSCRMQAARERPLARFCAQERNLRSYSADHHSEGKWHCRDSSYRIMEMLKNIKKSDSRTQHHVRDPSALEGD